jgi:hypothetical protein
MLQADLVEVTFGLNKQKGSASRSARQYTHALSDFDISEGQVHVGKIEHAIRMFVCD